MALLVTQHSPGQALPWCFSTAKPEELLLCAGPTMSASLLSRDTNHRFSHHTGGLPDCTQFKCNNNPSHTFWSVRRRWWMILGAPCLQFVISFHNNPAASQCLHVTVLCQAEENTTAFQTLLQAEKQALTLQAPSPTFNGFTIHFYFLKSKIIEKSNYDEPASPPHNPWVKPDKLE